MLELKLLGELEVRRDGKTVALPPSRKTRALLAYLASTGRSHRRERLCEMFWEVPDDPRGSLRWSLSRLRPVLDEPGVTRLAANRESVTFEPNGAHVDLAELRSIMTQGIEKLTNDDLQRAASLFKGEFLEGIDLPAQHEFQTWCAAEREDLRRTQILILSVLSERIGGERALPVLRQLVQVDPFNEQARAALLRLLVASGRQQEAESHFKTAERLFRDIGVGAGDRLSAAWRTVLREARATADEAPMPAVQPSTSIESPPSPPTQLPRHLAGAFVGRRTELSKLASVAEEVVATRRLRAVFLTGEPGIGKSRLARTFCSTLRKRGQRVLVGHSYDTKLSIPLGPWTEAVGDLPLADGPEPSAVGRSKLFAEVTSRLFDPTGSPTVLLLEDIQWADEASAELLHHVIRSAEDKPLLILATARQGELADNLAIGAVLRGLRREKLLIEIEVLPLAPAEINEIIVPVAHEADRARIVELSAGNPLYAEELARDEDGTGLPRSLKDIVRDRIDRLGSASSSVVQWASVIGPVFATETLRAVADLEVQEFLQVADRLEREHILIPANDTHGKAYAFGHELVRQAIYTSISAPRRRVMHLKIARELQAPGGVSSSALELAEHAAAGGDASMASRACVAAARHSARLFAHADAAALVRQGRIYAERLSEPERVERLIELAEIEVGVTPHADLSDLIGRLEGLAQHALDCDRGEHASRCYRLLATLRWEGGAWSEAQRDTQRAEIVSRGSDDSKRARALGEAARCLAMLERDLHVAESLALEGEALGKRAGVEPNAVSDALGMLRCHQGEFERGREMFERARLLAQHEGDRTGEFLAIEHALTLDIEIGRFDDVSRLCQEAVNLASKLPAGSDLPFAKSLQALCQLVRGHPGSAEAFDAALAELQLADAKHRLAFAAVTASRIFLERGDVSRATSLAEMAYEAATLIDRKSDMVTALAMLARIAAANGDTSGREAYLDRLGEVMVEGVSEAALRAAESALSDSIGSVPMSDDRRKADA